MALSTYYAARTRPASVRSVRDAELRPVLRQLWEDNYRVYGARKLWKAARRAGGGPRPGGAADARRGY